MAILAAIASLGLSNLALATTFNDAPGGGDWNTPATWGGTDPLTDIPTATTDIINISQSLVTATAGNAAGSFSGGEIHISNNGTLQIIGPAWYTPNNSAAMEIYMNGGTFDIAGNTTVVASATKLKLDIEGVSVVRADKLQNGSLKTMAQGATLGSGGANGAQTYSLQLSGSGTMVIFAGNSYLKFGCDTSGSTPTGSTFNGILDVRSGQLQVGAADFTNQATVILNGDGTSLQVYSGSGLVNNLYGSGGIAFNGTGRALRIGDELNPAGIDAGNVMDPTKAGTDPTQVGKITYSGSGKNDLIFQSGSQLTMDVFGENDADQIVWTDTTGTSVVNFDNANLVVQMFTPGEDFVGDWTLITADVFGANGKFLNDDGSNVTFGNNPGWTLTLDYIGDPGSRQVVLHGEYTAPSTPEPASLALIGLGGMLLLRRRRHGA